MGKLVRDRIPEIMASAGLTPETRILDTLEYLDALFEKLIEEAQELRDANASQRLEEAADVLEVFNTILTNLGYTVSDVAAAATVKREQRGGFTERVWLGS
ncbi:nucleoside triphosphate pyrophosphohydrolase [Arthrobacter sp. 162MFSha1.1]|uniref:nucleoside triphosphate pyrophosphohydrolase n=1 Tax=Arthrobacter sp. 162MFSha1.1 TaxID=1151119 RepID=UPI00036E291F|nr:nucleoside triphosphate pyrophosphohydrolase [Arthrobacter sp. 162MFSha1.1]